MEQPHRDNRNHKPPSHAHSELCRSSEAEDFCALLEQLTTNFLSRFVLTRAFVSISS